LLIFSRCQGENPNANVRVLNDLSVGINEDMANMTGFLEKDLHSLKGKPERGELVVGDIRDQ